MFPTAGVARVNHGVRDAPLHRNATVHHGISLTPTSTVAVPTSSFALDPTVVADHTARASAMEMRVSKVYEAQQRLLAKETTLRTRVSELLTLLERVGPVLRERLCAQLSMHALVTRTAFPPSEGEASSTSTAMSTTEQLRRLLHSQQIRGRLCQFRDSPATLCDSLEASSFALLIPVLHEIVREETLGLSQRTSRIPDILIAAVEVLHEASFRFSSAFHCATKKVQFRALVVDLEGCYRALCEMRERSSIATAATIACGEGVVAEVDPPPRKKHRPDTPKQQQHDVSSSSVSSQGRSSGASTQYPAVAGCRHSLSACCESSLRTSLVSDEEGRHSELVPDGTTTSRVDDAVPAPVLLRRLHDTIRRVGSLVEGCQAPDV